MYFHLFFFFSPTLYVTLRKKSHPILANSPMASHLAQKKTTIFPEHWLRWVPSGITFLLMCDRLCVIFIRKQTNNNLLVHQKQKVNKKEVYVKCSFFSFQLLTSAVFSSASSYFCQTTSFYMDFKSFSSSYKFNTDFQD